MPLEIGELNVVQAIQSLVLCYGSPGKQIQIVLLGSGTPLQQIPKNMEVALELGNALKSLETHDRKSLNRLEQTIGRNMDVKGAANEGPEGNEEMLVETGRKKILVIE